MKGLVFNFLEEVVSAEYGPDTWDNLIDAAGVEGAYTSLGNYPDEELGRIVIVASTALGLPPNDIVRWFGRECIPLFAKRYSPLFDAHQGVRTFALSLNDFIHPEVRKLYPGAVTPDFTFDTSRPNGLVMTYRSPRRLCAFAEGLLHGAADHYLETLTITQTRCMHNGDDECVLELAIA